MRMAANRDEVLASIEARTGVCFSVIDADKEAAYTLAAVRARMANLGIANDSLAMIDVGGGSTEVIFYKDGERVSRSFPIGIVTVAQRCETTQEVRRLLGDMLASVRGFVQEYRTLHGEPECFVLTAGTPTTVAAFLQGMTYDTYDANRINGFVLSREACERALDALLRLDEATRAKYVGVGRESLIAAGIVIIEAFYDVLGFDEGVVIDDGVREGVALMHCSDALH